MTYLIPIISNCSSLGTISPINQTGVVWGQDQTYKITPNAGYYIAQVLVDGESIGPVNTYTFYKVIAPHSISVSFQSVYAEILFPNSGYSAESGLEIAFLGSLSNPSLNATATFYWSFGDGGTATGPNPTYSYSNLSGNPELSWPVLLTVVDVNNNIYTAKIQINILPFATFNEPRTPLRYHIFSSNTEDQYLTDQAHLISFGTPKVTGTSYQPVGMNNYRFDRCLERYPQANQPIDQNWFLPGLRTIKLPVHTLDSGFLVDFSLDSSVAVFADDKQPGTSHAINPQTVGIIAEDNLVLRMLSSDYYQSFLDAENAYITANPSCLSEPTGSHALWSALRLSPTFCIDPRTSKVLMQTGNYSLAINGENTPDFWLPIAYQRLLIADDWDQRPDRLDSKVVCNYSFDFDKFNGYTHLDLYLNQDHYQVKLNADQSMDITLNGAWVQKELAIPGVFIPWTTSYVFEVNLNIKSTLVSGIGLADTSITLVDASSFTKAGSIMIDQECLSYSSNSGTVLGGLARGINSTTTAIHAINANVYQVTPLQIYNLTSTYLDQSFYLNPNPQTIQTVSQYLYMGTFYVMGSFVGDWYIRRNLPREDQRYFANHIGFCNFAIPGATLTISEIATPVGTLDFTSNNIYFESPTNLNFPESSFQAFPPTLSQWDWSEQDTNQQSIFGYTSGTISSQVDISNSRIMKSLCFDDPITLPILATGSVTMLYCMPEFDLQVIGPQEISYNGSNSFLISIRRFNLIGTTTFAVTSTDSNYTTAIVQNETTPDIAILLVNGNDTATSTQAKTLTFTCTIGSITHTKNINFTLLYA